MLKQDSGSIYFKKQWHEEGYRGLSFLSSALFFGESTFTTMRLFEGKIVYLQDHLERLQKSISFLFEEYSEDWWENFEQELIAAASFKHAGYLRATAFRDYEALSFFFYHRPFSLEMHNNPEVTLMRSITRKGEGLRPTYLKTGDYLEAHLELERAKHLKFDEILFLSMDEHILECSTSNIFWVHEGKVYTPASGSRVLEGVMRKNVIRALKDSNWPVTQGHYNVDILGEASEVWIANALRGLTYVSRFEDKHYTSKNIYEEVLSRLRDFKDGQVS